jgi:hypothetical protein
VSGRIEERAAGGFCQAVGIENVDAKGVKIAGNGRIESRASSHQIAHARTEGRVNLPKEELSRVDSDSPQRAVEGHQRVHQRECEFAAFVQFFENAFMDQVEKLGHHTKRSDVAFLQSAQQFGGVQGFEVHHARTVEERQEQIRHLRKHVKHGKNSEQRILRADLNYPEHGIRLADQIGVRKHDSLGIGGGARGVEQRGEVALGGDDGLKAGRAGGEDGIQIGGKSLFTGRGQALGAPLIAFCAMGGIRRQAHFGPLRSCGCHHQTYVDSLDGFHSDWKMLHIAEQQGGSAVDQ